MIFQVAIIEWDQKLGGRLTYVAPDKSFTLTSGEAMNIYNMHRIRRTEPNFGTLSLRVSNGKRYRISSFFSGYGMSTSPDGFTGNYGQNIIGLAERIVCLILPQDKNGEAFFNPLALISARILLDADKVGLRVDQIAKYLIESQLLEKPDDLLVRMQDERFGLDSKLQLTQSEISKAFELEAKILHYLIKDQFKKIQELKFNAASSMGAMDSTPVLDEIQKYKGKISELENVIKERDTQIQLLQTYKKQKIQMERELRQLKAGASGAGSGMGSGMSSGMGSGADPNRVAELEEKNRQLESELKNVKDSTQSLLDDMRRIIMQKDQEIAGLKERLNIV